MKKLRLLLIKAASIPEGARWVTIHPGGVGKGQPVLIQPQPDGSAKVIGGAGGSLNHLRLRGVKSHSEYKAEASSRATDKRKARSEQIAADKASGTHEEKQKARQAIRDQRRDAERQVIAAVAKKAGWNDADLQFPEDDYAHLSEKALAKVRDRHHAGLLKRAKGFIGQAREQLVSDASARTAAGIGEIPLFSDNPEDLSVEDLAPIKKQSGGLGFDPNYKGRAEAAGLTDEALAVEAQSFKLSQMTPEQKAAAFARGKAPDLIKQELAGIKEPPAPHADASLLSAKDALDLVKEGKRLAEIEKQARAAVADVDSGPAEPKAFVLESSDDADLDEAARAAVINDLRTAGTVAFLSEVGKIAGANPSETLGGHVGVGAYNSINSLALAVGGEALVDRSVVDVLGIAGAAQVLARRLHSDLSPDDMRNVADGVQDWHLNHYMTTSTEALKKARDLADAAEAIEPDAASGSGHDLSVAQELNARRRAAVGDAQRILGQALGEMEANAALVVATKQGKPESVQVSLGKTGPEQAIKQVRAIGLLPGDYTLERVAGDTFLTVSASGMDRLAKPVSRDDVQRVRRNVAIMRGDHDEDDWLPLGVANRPDLAMDVKPGVAERLAKPFEPGGDLEQALRDYIGGRAADGDAPADILADIQSSAFLQKSGNTEAYRAALDAVAPLKGADGKMRPVESHSEAFEKMADDYVAKLGGDRSPIHRQKFSVDQKSVDALHRALSDTPEGVAAYKPIGELGSSDQGALRGFFHANIAKESPEAAGIRSDLEKLTANEPERRTTDMFGEEVDNPEWKDWRATRDSLSEKLNASSLTWSKYVKAMGGNAKAYESVQDAVRSRVTKSFVDAHNTLNPDAPLKLGKSVIRNNLDHLDAVDRDAMDARMAKQKALIDGMRERVAGKYASGSVSGKLAEAKEQQAAFEQSQMGFFSSEDLFGGVPDALNEPVLGADERHTIGHAAEMQIAGMMGAVGQNFKPGQPTKLWRVSMSGKYAAQQRAIKLVAANERVVLAAGAGSGKTNMMLGAHAHLSGLGKVKRSLMLVPSIVQGQFNGEALRLLEPGKFKTHIQPGASRDERIAAYKDPDTHIAVMTHQSFRDDMVHLGAKHDGVDEAAMVDRLQSMSPAERKTWIAGVMEKEGIHFDASFVDEAHDTLNRAGKENSGLSNVVEALGHNTPYHVYASGDPVKNDACLHPDTPITDPVTGVTKSVSSWAEDGEAPYVWALNQETWIPEVVRASVPFVKTKNRPMFKVALSSADDITVAADHKFLSPDGWQHLSDLSVGALVAVVPHSLRGRPFLEGQHSPGDTISSAQKLPSSLPPSLSVAAEPLQKVFSLSRRLLSFLSKKLKAWRDTLLTSVASFAPLTSLIDSSSLLRSTPSRHDLQCALHCSHTGEDCPGGCSMDSRLRDGRLHFASKDDQASAPLQAGVQPSSHGYQRSDAILQGREYTHPWLRFFHLSICGDSRRYVFLSSIRSFCSMRSLYECSKHERRQESHHQFDLPCIAGSGLQQPTAQSVGGTDRIFPFQNPSKEVCIQYAAILSITKVDSADIYDLEVPVHHNYLANWIWHHNTEVFSMLQKMDPERYADRAEFMRRYGADTIASKTALQREMARHVYATSITPDVDVSRKTETVPLSAGQNEALADLDKNIARARTAHRNGKVDVEAVRAISPASFEGVPESEHEGIAASLQKTVGVLRSSASNRIINYHPDNAKVARAVELVKARDGKQGVVFARNRESVEQYRKALEAAGKRVVTITGSDGPAEKDRKRRMFNPEKGEAEADVLVASDAGAVGVNLQSGQYLIQHDVSMTAKTHSQRAARIHRLGQKNAVELIDLVGDHKDERQSRDRLMKKYALKDMMASPLDGLDDSGVAGAIAARRASAADMQGGLF